MHWFLKFILGTKLYMFWTVPPSIIRSFSLYTQQWYMSYRFAKIYMFRIVPSLHHQEFFSLHTAIVYAEQVCWNLHVSDSSSVHHQEFFSVHTAVAYVIQFCWNLHFSDSSSVHHQELFIIQTAVVYFIQVCWNLHVSDSSSVHHQEFFTIHTAMVYVIQFCWQLASRSICSCSQAVSKPVWHIPLLRVKWKTPDDGQMKCPKHVEFHSKNKFEKLVHLVDLL
jgi:hypothetical protein